MFSEPAVACRECHLSLTLAQAASQGMRCSRCGGEPISVDMCWHTGQQSVGPYAIPLADSSVEHCMAELLLQVYYEIKPTLVLILVAD